MYLGFVNPLIFLFCFVFKIYFRIFLNHLQETPPPLSHQTMAICDRVPCAALVGFKIIKIDLWEGWI